MHNFFKSIHHEFNLSIIHVTHNFDEAIRLADNIAVLNRGKIEQIGSASEIFKSPANSFVARFTETDNLIPLVNKGGKFYLEGLDIPLALINSNMQYAILHSENIILSKNKITSSARFSLQGTILRIIESIVFSDVIIDIGFDLIVKITNYSVKKLDMKIGSKIFITFKESSLIYI